MRKASAVQELRDEVVRLREDGLSFSKVAKSPSEHVRQGPGAVQTENDLGSQGFKTICHTARDLRNWADRDLRDSASMGLRSFDRGNDS